MDKDAWQLDARPAGAAELVIALGGRWCMAAALPSPDSVTPRLAANVRRVRFDATGLTDWDTGLPSFLGGVLKTCAASVMTIEPLAKPHLRALLSG